MLYLMSRKSSKKEVYAVRAYGPEFGPDLSCTVECNRKGNLEVIVLRAEINGDIYRGYGSKEIAGHVAREFAKTFISGFINLVQFHLGSRLPPAVSYFREYGKAMFTHWILAERAMGARAALPPDGLIDAWVQVARETPDLERVSGDLLFKIWKRTLAAIVAEKGPDGSVAELVAHVPSWGRLGRLVIELDDVMEDPARPFVLTTSYVSGVAGSRAVVMTPISVPIFGECRVPGLRQHLYSLLRQAAQGNPVVRRLFESQEIFSPCYLMPRDAHAFVRDIAALEALGIEVSLPRWWKDLRQPEVRVRAQVGTAAPRRIGAVTMLDLRTSYVVGEHELSEGEWRALVRDNPDGLTNIRGEWVDLVHGRIRAAVTEARRLGDLSKQGGLTYAQADELIRRRPEKGDEEPNERPSSPVVIEPGEWFGSALAAIERRELRREAEPGVRLRAQLFGYQRQGIAWLSMLADAGVGACLADDMGLGKTLQVIALVVALLRRGDPGPHLIIVPASLLTNWRKEFERFAPTIDVGIVHGVGQGEEDLSHYVTLSSYGTVIRREVFLQREWGLLALDEAQEIKNPKTQVSQAVKRLPARMRICLTGTPVENHLGELWSLMDFLNPGYLGTESEFRGYCDELLRNRKGLAALRERIQHFILRRVKTDPEIALDLPSKVEVTVYCWMTGLQSDLYAQTYAIMRADFEAADSRARQGIALRILGRLKQICDHPALVLDKHFDSESSGKFLRLEELARTITEGGDRMLVFTQYQEMTGPIAAHLERVLGRPGAILDGSIPPKRRQSVVAEFQTDDGPPFLVLTYGVGGTGFNLTAACHVVLFDRWWNPAVESQAMDRAFRIGQTKGVVVHKFVCRGTLEERIDALISRKHELAKELFSSDDLEDPGASERALSGLSSEELLSLLALDPSLAQLCAE